MHDNFFRTFEHGTAHLSFVYFFKVLNISDLAWLSDSSAVTESLPTIVLHCICRVVGETAVHEVAADESACAAFSSVAMNNCDVLHITYQIYPSGDY
jgi:hypothetical protein